MKLTLLISTAAVIIGFSFFGNHTLADARDPQVVRVVDLQSYSGKWFEIAHEKNFYQRGCVRSTAEYGVIDDSSLSVYNRCIKKNGQSKDIRGIARVVDPAEPAKLRVKFNFFQKGDYWIIDLDRDYKWAIVSGPKKKSLFILSRVAPMDEKLLAELLDRLKAKGFETDSFIFDEY